MTDILHLTDENFATEVTESDKPVLVDVWGPRCVPCVQLDPVVKTLGEEFAGRVKIVKLVAPENRALCGSIGVMGLPTFLGFLGGAEVMRKTGDDVSEKDLRDMMVRLEDRSTQ
jgi:thioredoxin 1